MRTKKSKGPLQLEWDWNGKHIARIRLAFGIRGSVYLEDDHYNVDINGSTQEGAFDTIEDAQAAFEKQILEFANNIKTRETRI